MILLGLLAPVTGTFLDAHVRISWILAFQMFLLGLTLSSRDIRAGLASFRQLGVALAGVYVVLPVLLAVSGRALFPAGPDGRPHDYAVGLIILGAAPCTIVSATVLTRVAGGRDVLALSTTVASNFLCFLAAPAVLLLALGEAVSLRKQAPEMIGNVFLSVVLPVGVGQLARLVPPARRLADRHARAVSRVAQALILAVVLIAVSKAAASVAKASAAGGARAADVEGKIAAGPIALLLVLVAAVHAAGLAYGWLASRVLSFPRGDTIAVMLSGAEKTLPVSVYLWDTFFSEKYDFAILPLFLYHAVQLTMDALLAGVWARRGGAPGASPPPPGSVSAPEAGR